MECNFQILKGQANLNLEIDDFINLHWNKSRFWNDWSLCPRTEENGKQMIKAIFFFLKGGVRTWVTSNGCKEFVHPFCADYSHPKHWQMYQSNLHQQATELCSVWEELLIVVYILLDRSTRNILESGM